MLRLKYELKAFLLGMSYFVKQISRLLFLYNVNVLKHCGLGNYL